MTEAVAGIFFEKKARYWLSFFFGRRLGDLGPEVATRLRETDQPENRIVTITKLCRRQPICQSFQISTMHLPMWEKRFAEN
jgi:hypothetical protein